MYIGCPELVFMQLNTTASTNDDKSKIVNLSHNWSGRLKMRLFWQRKELFSWNSKEEKQTCFI